MQEKLEHYRLQEGALGCEMLIGREDYAHRENTYESLRTALPDE